VILRMLIKGKQRVDVIRKMEAEVGVMWLEHGERENEPRNGGSLWKLEKKKKPILSQSLQKAPTLTELWVFSPEK
jgi:hypothetical protein